MLRREVPFLPWERGMLRREVPFLPKVCSPSAQSVASPPYVDGPLRRVWPLLLRVLVPLRRVWPSSHGCWYLCAECRPPPMLGRRYMCRVVLPPILPGMVGCTNSVLPMVPTLHPWVVYSHPRIHCRAGYGGIAGCMHGDTPYGSER